MCLNCHVAEVEVEFDSLEALKNACTVLGWTFNTSPPTFRWFGAWVDDSPLPRKIFDTQEDYEKVLNMTRTERQKFMTDYMDTYQHTITVPGANYNIGVFPAKNNKYRLVWDSWHQGGLNDQTIGKNASFLTQQYAILRAHEEAKKLGCYSTIERTLEDGTVELRIEV